MQSYRSLMAQWLGSPNFTPGRDGHDMTQPSWIVLHTMVGTLAGANARFQQRGEQASATYGVTLAGNIVQWVDEADAAWANGATGRGGRGDNLDSISIEHEDGGDYNGPRTPQLYAASTRLVADICRRYAIPCDRDHVIGHRECDYAQTACPDALDVDRIVSGAAFVLANPPAVPSPTARPARERKRGAPVLAVPFNGQMHVFEVDQDGNLVHRFSPSTAGGWSKETLDTGLVPGSLVTADVLFGQLHVFGQNQDGTVSYSWWTQGIGWKTQQLD